ncbi:FAD binding domain-containing protein [Geopyxis carbonaria]|nr:FAD binding domain-containing protein [Geopyxis carbonaria]
MPVFDETSSAALRSRTTSKPLDPSLTRLTPTPPPNTSGPLADGARHEVVIVGTGPAGMMLNLLLNRAGVRPLAIEQQTANLLHGHADGIQPRTLEVLQQLGLASEVLAQGNANHRIAFWNPKPGGGIERTAVTDDVTVPSRYKHKVLLAAGRVCGILENEAIHYGGSVARGVEFVSFTLDKDASSDADFPVRVNLQDKTTGRQFSVQAKHLVGADGAHSKVREQMGGRMHGESTDYIWGVVDAVVSSDFPDFRKRCAIHSDAGSIMAIPRERISGDRWLVRLYTQLESAPGASQEGEAGIARARQLRNAVTLDRILSQVRLALAPYTIDVQHVDWWAAYQIGQRVSDTFALADRVFIMGDACHTHSPKAGQGMNVSMMDAHNLAWKLSHTLLGLAPSPSKLLSSYAAERRPIAQQLIAFDNAFASKFSQKMGGADGVTHDEFFKVFHTGGGFTSGCGIQYPPLPGLVAPAPATVTADPALLDAGRIAPGRRLLSVPTHRFCDDAPVHLHDALPNTGAYTILLLLPHSLARPVADAAVALAGRYPDGVVQPLLVHPAKSNDDVEWSAFPAQMQRRWWRGVVRADQEAYATLGVEMEKGAVVLVRPDGVVGAHLKALLWSLAMYCDERIKPAPWLKQYSQGMGIHSTTQTAIAMRTSFLNARHHVQLDPAAMALHRSGELGEAHHCGRAECEAVPAVPAECAHARVRSLNSRLVSNTYSGKNRFRIFTFKRSAIMQDAPNVGTVMQDTAKLPSRCHPPIIRPPHCYHTPSVPPTLPLPPTLPTCRHSPSRHSPSRPLP